MRRKSERTASKKTKASPEKKEKVEKVKRTRTRRRKQSTSSSESESTGDNIPKEPVVVSQTEAEVPPKPTKEDSPEESQEQVWHVKATETSGDVGEIQKLKICLARPPSTPERPDRSPRSKRKHSRATSSSDTQSVEGEEKKKSKHRSKRLTESKVEEKAQDNEKIEEESVTQTEASTNPEPESTETSVSKEQSKSTADETPMSTTNEETKYDNVESSEGKSEETKPQEESVEDSESQEKPSDADTTVASPKPSDDKEEGNKSPKQESPVRKRSLSEDKSEILEIHAEESRCESSEISLNESQDAKANLDQDKDIVMCNEVSINKSTTEISGKTGSKREDNIKRIKNDVENTKNIDTGIATAVSTESKEENGDNDSGKPIGEKVGKEDIDKINAMDISTENNSEELLQKQVVNKEDEICTINSKQDEDKIEKTGHKKSNENLTAKESSSNDLNGETSSDVTTEPITPLVINRKRRWGSRQSKFTTQRSITISTDILKEIIPDVKPTEFEEVIEERKHKKAERQSERIERPVLPKIIIDNTDNVVQNDRKSEERDKENVITRDLNVSSTRKISIVKENDSIITRPPSPPKHKQSNILYITNLVRPFTLAQLKNLLQRTGRIVENGFWIDRIKSKCFVKYENEDQAVETRHALHGVTWPVSNPKTLHVDFSTEEDFDSAKVNEENDNAQTSTIPGTVEDWLREQDLKREKGEMEKPWERKMSMREWDVGKNEKSKDIGRPDKLVRDERPLEKRRHRTPERSPEPARKFKKKEEEAPAKLLDDLFRKTKTTPCIYWLPLSAETIAVKEEQRRQHMAEHERRLQELQRNRPHRRH